MRTKERSVWKYFKHANMRSIQNFCNIFKGFGVNGYFEKPGNQKTGAITGKNQKRQIQTVMKHGYKMKSLVQERN